MNTTYSAPGSTEARARWTAAALAGASSRGLAPCGLLAHAETRRACKISLPSSFRMSDASSVSTPTVWPSPVINSTSNSAPSPRTSTTVPISPACKPCSGRLCTSTTISWSLVFISRFLSIYPKPGRHAQPVFTVSGQLDQIMRQAVGVASVVTLAGKPVGFSGTERVVGIEQIAMELRPRHMQIFGVRNWHHRDSKAWLSTSTSLCRTVRNCTKEHMSVNPSCPPVRPRSVLQSPASSAGASSRGLAPCGLLGTALTLRLRPRHSPFRSTTHIRSPAGLSITSV